MLVKGIYTDLQGAQLIRALLNGEFGYNSVCKCGKQQTKDSLKNIIKTHTSIDSDYVCKACQMSTECTVFGKTYRNIREATEATYDPKICKCEVCGKEITKEQWYQWCQKYLNENDGRIICHSCKSSEVRINLNERDHDKLSKAISERNSVNWQDPEYYEKHKEIFVNAMQKVWTNDERKYGEKGDLTLREYQQQRAHELISSDEGGLWAQSPYWNSTFLGRSRFSDDKAFNDDQKFQLILDAVDDLHVKYAQRLSNVSCTEEWIITRNKTFNDILDTLNIQHELYLPYVSKFGSNKSVHHVIPKSIADFNDLVINVSVPEHIMAHFLLFLDNFTRRLNPNLNKEKNINLTQIQIKIFMAFHFIVSHSIDTITDMELINDFKRIIKNKRW